MLEGAMLISSDIIHEYEYEEYIHIIPLRKEQVCFPEICFDLNVKINPRTKIKCVLYQHGPKSHSARRRQFLQKDHKTPDKSLQMNTGTKFFIPADMPCNLAKIKLNVLAIMIIVKFRETRGTLLSLETPFQL